MDSVSSTAFMDLDASFYTSGNWTSQLNPGDYAFAAQGTGEPTFDTDKFIMNGTSYLALTGSNTPVLRDMHKTTGGSQVTMGFVFKTPNATLANSGIFGTGGAGSATVGLSILLASTGAFRFRQHTGSVTRTTTPGFPFVNLVPNTWYTIFLAFDFVAGTLKVAQNARAFSNVTLTHSAVTADPSSEMRIGAYSDGIQKMQSGTEVAGWYMFNSLLTNDELSAAIDIIEARHSVISIT